MEFHIVWRVVTMDIAVTVFYLIFNGFFTLIYLISPK